VAAALLLAGCGAEEPAPGVPGSVEGQIVRIDTGAPVTGALVVLMDATANRPFAAAAPTGADGRYHIDRVPAGWYYAVTFSGRLLVFEADLGAFRVPTGGRLVRSSAM
jgi:hypothetical protein